MQWKKITAPAGFAIAAAFLFMAPAHAEQYEAKLDVISPAHFDTTFAAAPSDTVWFGFLADNVSVCVPATSSAVVTWYGGEPASGRAFRQPLLKSNSGGRTGNTRANLARFVSNAFTPPASSCYTYYGAPLCRGVIITGTWTGTVNLSADRVAK